MKTAQTQYARQRATIIALVGMTLVWLLFAGNVFAAGAKIPKLKVTRNK